MFSLFTKPCSLFSTGLSSCLCLANFWRDVTNQTIVPSSTPSVDASEESTPSPTNSTDELVNVTTTPAAVLGNTTANSALQLPTPWPSLTVVVCLPCPAGSHSIAGTGGGIAACVCNTGLYGDPAPTCVACPPGSTSADGATSIYDCICATGSWARFFPDPVSGSPAMECVPCGQYATTPAGVVATAQGQCVCMAGSYGQPSSAPDVAGCIVCPANSTSLQNSSTMASCHCVAGAAGSPDLGEVCVFCNVGTEPAPGGGRYCGCRANSYDSDSGSDVQAGTCIDCPAYSFSAMGGRSSAACMCYPGYYKVDDDGSIAGFQCLECPAYSSSSSNSTGPEACKCSSDFFRKDSSDAAAGFECQACPGNSTNSSISGATCSCNAGFYAEAAAAAASLEAGIGSCLPCPAGTHGLTAGGRNLTSACIPCPVNTTAPAGLGGPCSCLPGFIRAADGVHCKRA